MLDKSPDISNISEQQQLALLRWDGEGGAGPGGSQLASISNEAEADLEEIDKCRVGSNSHLRRWA